MSWQGLVSILTDAALQVRSERSRRPMACPHDGTPLQAGPDGNLYCPFDGWQAGSSTQADYLNN